MANILAFDQSYERTGFAVLNGEQLLDIGCIDFAKEKMEPWEKRNAVAQIAKQLCKTYRPSMVVVERVRLFSSYTKNVKKVMYGQTVQVQERKPGIWLPTIEALAKLNAFIVGAVRPLGIKTYSLDTKAWKNALFARLQGKDMKAKETSVWYIEQVFGVTVDHDAAEAACIALVASRNANLLVEET